MSESSAAVHIRLAHAGDLDAVAGHRVDLFREVSEPSLRAEMQALLEPSRAALETGLREGTCLTWIAEDHAVVGSVVMHLVNRLPSPKCLSGREGYVVHMFVAPSHRNRGVGERLIGAAVARARALGLSRVRLHSADAATPFYERAGFVHRTNDMELYVE